MDVLQAETNRAQQSIKWYRRWAFYGRKGFFKRPVRYLPYIYIDLFMTANYFYRVHDITSFIFSQLDFVHLVVYSCLAVNDL